MSVIGDYVHLKAANYMKYGISRKKEQSPTEQLRAFKDKLQIQATTIKVNNNQIRQLEKNYNIQKTILENSTDTDIQKIREQIITSLINQYGSNLEREVLNEVNYNFAQGSISLPTSVGQQEKLKQAKQIEEAKYSFVDTVQKQINIVSNQLKSIKNVETLTMLQSKIDAIQQKLNTLKQTALTAQDVGLRGAVLKAVGDNRLAEVIPNQEARKLVQELRETIALLSIPNLSNWLGSFEEMIARYVSLKIQGIATDEIIKIFNSELQAGKNKIITAGASKVDVSLSMTDLMSLNQKALKELQKTSQFQHMFNNKYNKLEFKITSTAESKADAYFQIDTLGLIGASIKNYNMSNPNFDIHIVNGTPLLPFLMGLKNNSMATHYLNILADHKDAAASGFTTAKTIGAEGLTYGFLYFALSGRGSGRQGGFADIFILNDNSDTTGNSARFFDVGNLIDNIIKLKKLNSVKINDKNALLYWQDVKLNNAFIENKGKQGVSIQMRLSNLIAASHREKLSLSLSKDIFNSILT